MFALAARHDLHLEEREALLLGLAAALIAKRLAPRRLYHLPLAPPLLLESALLALMLLLTGAEGLSELGVLGLLPALRGILLECKRLAQHTTQFIFRHWRRLGSRRRVKRVRKRVAHAGGGEAAVRGPPPPRMAYDEPGVGRALER